jgi:U3 small nucleolar RNA-associated protein 22
MANYHDEDMDRESGGEHDEESLPARSRLSNIARRKTKTIEQDANFLAQLGHAALDPVGTGSAASSSLHRSHVLRLQTDELIASTQLDWESVKWSKVVKSYLHHLKHVLEQEIEFPESLQYDHQTALAPLVSDWSPDRLIVQRPPKSESRPLLQMIIPSTNFEVLNKSANAHVLPTLRVACVLSSQFFSGNSNSKHVLRNRRYFDLRNVLCSHVAQQLVKVSASADNNIGQVMVRYDHGDVTKPALLLIPPLLNQSESPSRPNKKMNRDNRSSGAAAPQPEVPRTKKWQFRVLLTFGVSDLDWIPPLRLLPNRSNLSHDYRIPQAPSNVLCRTSTTASTEAATAVSPFYHYQILEEAKHLFVSIKDADVEEYPAWTGTIQLLQIWCLQRGFLRGHDAFESEHLALLLLYLYRSREVTPRMHPLQALASVFKLLSSTVWLSDSQRDSKANNNLVRSAASEAYFGHHSSGKRSALVLPLPGKNKKQTIAVSALARLYAQQTSESPVTDHDPPTLLELYERPPVAHRVLPEGPVFLDPTMTFNYFGRISPSFIRSVSREALRSLQRLHDNMMPLLQPHRYLFMNSARFWHRYDAYIRIPMADLDFRKSKILGWADGSRRDLGDYETTSQAVIEILRRSLTDRVTEIRVLTTGNGEPDASLTDPVQDADMISTWDVPTAPQNVIDQRLFSKGSRLPRPFQAPNLYSPNASGDLVIGLNFNSETCLRVVDRGPPADQIDATAQFVALWGSKKAKLRRFKDGAIVHAVVWSWERSADDNESLDANAGNDPNGYVRFENDDKFLGGIVERIIRHVMLIHLVKDPKVSKAAEFPHFSQRNILSAIDCIASHDDSTNIAQFDPIGTSKGVMKSFDTLCSFLHDHSKPSSGQAELKNELGLPLAIDAVEPLSPSLRYAELFPPVAHALLGGPSFPAVSKVSGAISSDPILIQLRFGTSSKWPHDLRAMGAAKTAMLVALANGIERLRQRKFSGVEGFNGVIHVTPLYADIPFQGYLFRVCVRCDQELKMLQALNQSDGDTISVYRGLRSQYVVAPIHHHLVHAVYTRYPSSSGTVRLAKRWVDSHLLSSYVPFEIIELLVASVYTSKNSPVNEPASVLAGLLRFLQLLGRHDWRREALIVDPQGNLTSDDVASIEKEFVESRGAEYKLGAPMYVISSADRPDYTDAATLCFARWVPSAGSSNLEWVVLNRIVALAERCSKFLLQGLKEFNKCVWPALFLETANSFRSYSLLLRIDSAVLVDQESSSTASNLGVALDANARLSSSYTRSMSQRWLGPKPLQRKIFKNLSEREIDILREFHPVRPVVSALLHKFGHVALFFYNDLSPEVVAVRWRPVFHPQSFTASVCENTSPVTNNGVDTVIRLNAQDVLREIMEVAGCVVVDVRVFAEASDIEGQTQQVVARKRKPGE